jgi:hypothetical protein
VTRDPGVPLVQNPETLFVSSYGASKSVVGHPKQPVWPREPAQKGGMAPLTHGKQTMIIGTDGIGRLWQERGGSNYLREDAGFTRSRLRRSAEKHARCGRIHPPQLYGDEKETPLPEFGGKTPRQMMQTLGTEWGRNLIDAEIWITLWKRQAEGLLERRTPSWSTMCASRTKSRRSRALAATVWRVDRPGVATMNHESEVHISSLRGP